MTEADNHTAEQPPCPPQPLPPPLLFSEEGSWAYYTLTERMPDILQRVIAENEFRSDVERNLRALADELPHGRVRLIEDDGGPDVAAWTRYLQPYLGQRWLDIPWYFGEAYFYRRILEATRYFSVEPAQRVDPFVAQKRTGLDSAMVSVRGLALKVNELARERDRRNRAGLSTLVHVTLWGNRADMSIWPAEDGGEDRSQIDVELEEENILVDDTPALVDEVERLRGERVDFVVDNAGFELVCDLCLADFFLASGAAGTVHLHLKAHPTFVSDAMGKDVRETVGTLAADDDSEARALAARLQEYLDAGRLKLREHFFWTAPRVFWEMPQAVSEDLSDAALVVVKGDANYRRLLGDRHWHFTTPFEDIVCYFPAPLVALRTLKSEVAAGLQPGQPEQIASEDPDWLVDGQWGVIQLVG